MWLISALSKFLCLLLLTFIFIHPHTPWPQKCESKRLLNIFWAEAKHILLQTVSYFLHHGDAAPPLQRGMWAWHVNIEGFTAAMWWEEIWWAIESWYVSADLSESSWLTSLINLVYWHHRDHKNRTCTAHDEDELGYDNTITKMSTGSWKWWMRTQRQPSHEHDWPCFPSRMLSTEPSQSGSTIPAPCIGVDGHY